MRRLLPVLLVLLGWAAPCFGAQFLWIEGEDMRAEDMAPDERLLDPDRSLLSGGNWLAVGPAEGMLGAILALEQEREFDIWLRGTVRGTRIGFAINSIVPEYVEPDEGATETVEVKARGTVAVIGWVYLGRRTVRAGHSALFLKMMSQEQAPKAVDCVCLVDFPWRPSGIEKPVLPPPPPDEWFVLKPRADSFSRDSIIDMRRLWHRPAGSLGRLSRRGADLVFADAPDRPVKLWGVCATMPSVPEADARQARFLAKYGVALVRRSSVSDDLGPLQAGPDGVRRLDPDALDRFDHWFAALKEQGIYLAWNCLDPPVVTADDGYPAPLFQELPGRGERRSAAGLVSLMPQIQQVESRWLEALLTHQNPYTGLRYADDPALAIIQLGGDDSLFDTFPLDKLAHPGEMPAHTEVFQRLWMDWVARRYGSDEALKQAWGAGMHPGDSVGNPRMDLYGSQQLAAGGPSFGPGMAPAVAERARMGDFVRFLAETQRSYYERRTGQLRSLGFQGLLAATSGAATGPAARAAAIWASDAADVVARYAYCGGQAGRVKVDAGALDNRSHLDRPGSLLLAVAGDQIEDKPFMLSEWTMQAPTQWKAEAAPLVAFYGMGLQGWDASCHDGVRMAQLGDGWPGLRANASETPHYMGQFPALAFALQKGHVAEAPIVAARRLAPDLAFAGFDALTQPLPAAAPGAGAGLRSLDVPPQTVAVGRITAKVADGLPPSERRNLAAPQGRDDKVAVSATGQLRWDWGRRVVTIQTDKTQGIVGFAGGGSYDLPGVRVEVRTPFVSLLFTPLDDLPLVESRQILITAMARDRQMATEYGADGRVLDVVGFPPLYMEPVQATVTLKGAPVRSVRVVDIYGVPTDREAERDGNTFAIDGRYATCYYEVLR